MVNFPPVPDEIKGVAHLLKIADEHESRNIVIAYWARMAACRLALTLAPGNKSPETTELIRAVIDWLEATKKANSNNEGLTNHTAAQAMIEQYALLLFDRADVLDKQCKFTKNLVKTFYTAGLVMDMLDQFDGVDEEFKEKRKYAKWKAAYIHNCLKKGETPLPGNAQLDQKIDEREHHMVPISDLTDAELKKCTYFQEPSEPSSSTSEPGAPSNNDADYFKQFGASDNPEISSTTPMPPFLSSLGPGNPDMSSTSPITPNLPTNPTPFNTPIPQVSPAATPSVKPTSPSGFVPGPQEVQKAQKYCKFAASALNYDDIKNAVDYLTKALGLLKQGTEDYGGC